MNVVNLNLVRWDREDDGMTSDIVNSLKKTDPGVILIQTVDGEDKIRAKILDNVGNYSLNYTPAVPGQVTPPDGP